MTDDVTDLHSLPLAFQIAINLLRVHEGSNEAARRALARLLEAIHYAFLEDGECVIVRTEGQLFVNSTRVRNLREVGDFISVLERLEVGGISFTSPPELDALLVFVTALARRGEWDAPEDCYVERLSPDLAPGGGEEGAPGAERGYRRSVGEMRALFRDANEKGNVSLRRARRVSGNVVESLATDESVLFGLMAIRDYDQYTFQHCVNVCILSTALGTRIGLSRSATRDLGVAGLLHDVGKLAIPRRILNKPGRFTPAEWEVMKTHPAAGARILLGERGLAPSIVKAVKVALHHHIRYDGGGYPTLTFATAPGIFSRIVTIADCYDAMTSIRAYRESPIHPPHVIAHIWAQAGSIFHPLLAKRFVGMLGAYPPGSVVELSDGTIAVVVEVPRGDNPFRPVVRRFGDATPEDLGSRTDVGILRPAKPDQLGLSDDEISAHLKAA